MSSAPVRFAVEALVLVAIGVGLAVTDVGLALFAIVMAVAWLGVAGLERAVLQRSRADAQVLDQESLPLHEGGVQRDAEELPVEAGAPAEREAGS